MSALALFQSLKRTYVEAGGVDEWAKVYSALLEMPNPPYTTFTRLGYFRGLSGPVQRFQDIPDHQRTYRSPAKLFVSHKWAAPDHPDRSGRTLRRLLSLASECDDDVGVWWDFCSLPQRDCDSGVDDRSATLKDFFRFQLSLIPLVILDSQSLFLWGEDGTDSGWCCIELLLAMAILQHLNRMIYARRDQLRTPPLFAIREGSVTRIETDLVRFEHQVVERMFCDEVAYARHGELIVWVNEHLNDGRPTPYTRLLERVTPAVIEEMMSEHELAFTNGADRVVVSRMLHAVLQRLSVEPFDGFKWSGKVPFESVWHYVRGSFGGCVVPHVAYTF